MIRLKPVPKPAELTAEKEKELYSEFIRNKTRVWNQTYIKNALLEMSHHKCCFCECKIDEESKYLEVEHFYPKSQYPEKVVQWENLLPACKRCNGKKGDHDTRVEPIIHPVEDDPRDHLVYENFLIKHRDHSKIGDTTVRVLVLNDDHRLVNKRMEIGKSLKQALADLNDWFTENLEIEVFSSDWRNCRYNTLKGLLYLGIPSINYSATSAAIILNDVSYSNIRENFKKYGLWDSDLQALEDQVRNCALEMQ